MRVSRALIGAGLALGLTVAAPAFAAAQTTLDLELNEPAGSTVAVDSSGMGHNGAIGSHIKMNGSYGTWDRHSPDAGIYYGAAHLIMINDAADGRSTPARATSRSRSGTARRPSSET